MSKQTANSKNRSVSGFLYIIIAIIIVIIILLIGAATLCISAFRPSSKQADLSSYLSELFPSYDNDAYGILIRGDSIEDTTAYFAYNRAYLPLSYAQSLNSRIYWDSDNLQLRYCLPERVLVTEANSYEYNNGTELVSIAAPYVIYDSTEDSVYISVEFIADHTDMVYGTFSEPNRLWIVTEEDEADLIYATVIEESEDGTAMRTAPSIKADIVENLDFGEAVLVLGVEKSFTLVRDSQGISGYIKSDRLSDAAPIPAIDSGYTEPEYPSLSVGSDICLLWHQTLGGDDGVAALPDILDRTDGKINVIAPTFFLVADEAGNLDASAATKEYVSLAHEHELYVWAMVDNINISIDSYALLSNTEARNNLIDRLIANANEFDLDGINVDFEGLTAECGPHYLEFIRELSVACRREGLYLSTDNYVPSEYTAFYDRAEQGIWCDYVIMMGYDEHYAGSEPGSTASLSFVQQGIEDSLAQIPAEKFICGVPFYARLWNLTDGSSKAVGMTTCMELSETYGANRSWQEETGQNFLTFEEDGSAYEIWLEDLSSQKARLALIRQYRIAGIGCWKAGLDLEEVWELY